MAPAHQESAMNPELRALITRAAELEGRRQQAIRKGDVEAVAGLDLELRKLWREYSRLERNDDERLT